MNYRKTKASAILFLGVLGWLFPNGAGAEIAGHWEGAFTRQGAVQIVAFDFQQTDSGLVGTYDIPDMILYRKPIKNLLLRGDTLSFRVFWGAFSCLVHDDIGEITGENPNWGPSVSLHLKSRLNPIQIRISQVQIPTDSLTLEGDLLMPAGNPPFPAVVVIEGGTFEGRQSWTYRSIGDMFARNGIAALVFDKRGTGKSEGEFDNAGLDDLANDVSSAIHFLSNRDDIDAGSIGLFGISQGGWLAPLAAQRSGNVSYVIMLAGPAVSVWEQELHRVEYSMRAGINGENEPDFFTKDEIASALAHTRLGFHVAQNPEQWNEWMSSVINARTKSWTSYVILDSTLASLQGWLRYQYDPKETLQNMNVPVLALFGGSDVLVPPTENVALLQSYFAKAGNERYRIVVFPNVGHDFFTGASLVGGEWNWPEHFWQWNSRAKGLADTIITWTRQQVVH